jgi:hypothetical protein
MNDYLNAENHHTREKDHLIRGDEYRTDEQGISNNEVCAIMFLKFGYHIMPCFYRSLIIQIIIMNCAPASLFDIPCSSVRYSNKKPRRKPGFIKQTRRVMSIFISALQIETAVAFAVSMIAIAVCIHRRATGLHRCVHCRW